MKKIAIFILIISVGLIVYSLLGFWCGFAAALGMYAVFDDELNCL